MKTKQTASDRLFKKISALRATLPADERAVLDDLIAKDEVTGHRMKMSKTLVKAGGKTASKTEVKPHQMKMDKTPVKSGGKTASKTEVKSHQMKLGKTPVKTSVKTNSKVNEVAAHQMKAVKPQIRYDADSEEYKPVDG
jgi:hypothetical protein